MSKANVTEVWCVKLCVRDGGVALLGCYAALIGGYLPAFRDCPLKMELIGFLGASISTRKYQTTVLIVPAERSPKKVCVFHKFLRNTPAAGTGKEKERRRRQKERNVVTFHSAGTVFDMKATSTLMAFS